MCQRTCWGRCSQCRMLSLIKNWAHTDVTHRSTSVCYICVRSVLHQLHWLLVQKWVEFKITCLVHQLLASLAPTDLTVHIHLGSEYAHRLLHSSTDRTLTVQQTHNRFGDRSFDVVRPRLWNSLPITLWQTTSYRHFRRYLKAHLFGIWEITAQCEYDFLCYTNMFTYLLLWT